MAFPLAVALGLWLTLAPTGARAADGDGGISLPEPPNTVSLGGRSVAMRVQSSLGAATASRIGSFSGGSTDRKKRFRRLVTWVLLLLAAVVVLLKCVGKDEPPAPPPAPPKGPGGSGPGGSASDRKPGERPPGPRGC